MDKARIPQGRDVFKMRDGFVINVRSSLTLLNQARCVRRRTSATHAACRDSRGTWGIRFVSYRSWTSSPYVANFSTKASPSPQGGPHGICQTFKEEDADLPPSPPGKAAEASARGGRHRPTRLQAHEATARRRRPSPGHAVPRGPRRVRGPRPQTASSVRKATPLCLGVPFSPRTSF